MKNSGIYNGVKPGQTVVVFGGKVGIHAGKTKEGIYQVVLQELDEAKGIQEKIDKNTFSPANPGVFMQFDNVKSIDAMIMILDSIKQDMLNEEKSNQSKEIVEMLQCAEEHGACCEVLDCAFHLRDANPEASVYECIKIAMEKCNLL